MTTHDEDFPKWNIIFLIYAKLGDDSIGTSPYNPNEDADTLVYLTSLKNEIRGIPLSPNFNIVLIDNEIEVKNGKKISDNTYISVLESDPENLTVNKIDTKTSYDMEDFAQKGDILKLAFQYVETQWPAEKILLVTWDHGSAFGIFKTTIPLSNIGSNFESIIQFNLNNNFDNKYEIIRKQALKTDFVFTDARSSFEIIRNRPYKTDSVITKNKDQFFSAILEAKIDDEVVDILTNDELSNAIKEGFAKQYVDVLVMFNCYMQNVHTCYSLRDQVKFIVAPEGVISVPGYDYTAIARAIANTQGIEAEDVAGVAVLTMRNKFALANLKDKFEEHAMFSVALENYQDKIISKLKEFVQEIRSEIAANILTKGNTVLSRQSCYELDLPLNYSMVDFINWSLRLLTKIGPTEIADIQVDLEAAYHDIITASDVGNNIYTVTSRPSWERESKTAPKGATIYFPSSAMTNDDEVFRIFAAVGAPFRMSVLDEIGWLPFLDELYR
ncbi:MAG: clostripain-related cysteine peptidase [Bacteroidota bacterium]